MGERFGEGCAGGLSLPDLTRLGGLPVSVIHTGASLLEGPAGWSLMASVAGIAMDLRMEVRADGVETEEALRRMQALKIDVGQGPLFSQARTAPGIEKLLHTPGWLGLWEGPAATRTAGQSGGQRRRERPPVRHARHRQSSTVSPKTGVDTER